MAKGILSEKSVFVHQRHGEKLILTSVYLPILTTYKPTPVDALLPGQIGYFIASCLQPSSLLGKTLTTSKEKLNEYRNIKPFSPSVYASFYPDNPKNYKKIEKSIESLILNDPVVTVEHTGSPTYGSGYKLGFLGSLHMEVFSQRLK